MAPIGVVGKKGSVCGCESLLSKSEIDQRINTI